MTMGPTWRPPRGGLRAGGERLEARTMLASTLAISEINYHPYEPVAEFGDVGESGSDFEFIELLNVGDQPVDLQGVSFQRQLIGGDDEGVDFLFQDEMLAPGERLVVVEDLESFRSRYGDQVRVAGQWSGGLSNDGETIALFEPDGTPIVEMEYRPDDDWPSRAAGLGASLENVSLMDDPNDPDSWDSSVSYGGTPGADPIAEMPSIVFNEILAHTDLPQIDIIELYNTTNQPIDVSGWYVTDTIESPFNFAIPDNSIIPPQGYLLLDETHFNPGGGTLPTDFALSERGDDLWLISAQDDGRPDQFVDRVQFDATLNGVTIGNIPDGNTSGDMQPMNEITLGSANTGHFLSDIVVSEVQYHPPNDGVQYEFIELTNRTAFAMALDDWRLSGAVDMIVPPDTTIPAFDTVVLVSFDPSDETAASAFRDFYGITADVQLVGPWDADSEGEPDALSNGGEEVNLRMPQLDVGPPEEILHIRVDQVDYDDDPPWPVVADGEGSSLHRVSNVAYGNVSESWVTGIPTPGNEPIDLTELPVLSTNEPIRGEIGMDATLIRGAADVDLYWFTPTASREYELRVASSADDAHVLNPFLRIFDDTGEELAFNDDQAPDSQDSVVVVDLRADNDYLVAVSGASDGARQFDPITGRNLSIGSTGLYDLSVQPTTSNTLAWHNAALPEDVTGDDQVVPFDALAVINALNAAEIPVDQPLSEATAPPPPPYLDVNGDNFLSPIDALLVINFLNAQAAEGEAPSRSVPAAATDAAFDATPAIADQLFAIALWDEISADQDELGRKHVASR